MQAKLDNQTTVPYTAYAASPGQLLSENFGQFLQWKRVHQATKLQANAKNNWCIQVQLTANLAIPLFELQKLISAQTLESETKLHPKPSEARGYTYSLSWALQVCTFHHLSSATVLALTYATLSWSLLWSWWHEMNWKSTMEISWWGIHPNPNSSRYDFNLGMAC